MQAKKSCPFIHVASASSLRRLMGKNNLLLNKAKSCPIMGQALSARSISTSANGKTVVKKIKKVYWLYLYPIYISQQLRPGCASCLTQCKKSF